jgi:hypothetical protein
MVLKKRDPGARPPARIGVEAKELSISSRGGTEERRAKAVREEEGGSC